jgi:hypothetical protein
MRIRRTLALASVVGLSLVGTASPAPAQKSATPPKLATRCYAQDMAVPATYAELETLATRWMGTCVAAGRERKLVSGSASLRAVWGKVEHLAGSGKSARVTADFGWKDLGGSWGVERVTFATSVERPAASPAMPPSPSASPPPRSLPPTLLPDEALPASLEPELRVALVRVRAAIDQVAGTSPILSKDQAHRLRCQLTKLADPKTDDRQVSGIGACGVIGLSTSASQCSERTDLRIKAIVKTTADLDRQELWFMHHLRPEIVNASRRLFLGDSPAAVVRSLGQIDADKSDAVLRLRKMGERTQGFLPVPHYRAINDWIAKEQRDPSSINACR